MISTSFDATRSQFFGAQSNDRRPRATPTRTLDAFQRRERSTSSQRIQQGKSRTQGHGIVAATRSGKSTAHRLVNTLTGERLSNRIPAPVPTVSGWPCTNSEHRSTGTPIFTRHAHPCWNSCETHRRRQSKLPYSTAARSSTSNAERARRPFGSSAALASKRRPLPAPELLLACLPTEELDTTLKGWRLPSNPHHYQYRGLRRGCSHPRPGLGSEHQRGRDGRRVGSRTRAQWFRRRGRAVSIAGPVQPRWRIPPAAAPPLHRCRIGN